MEIKYYSSLDIDGQRKLARFISNHEDKILPYHYLSFIKVIDGNFNYKNLSLVAFDENGMVVGFLPQWKRGKIIESVPWRDKGGPICRDAAVLPFFIRQTQFLIKNLNCKGFLWKDYSTKYLDNYEQFVNIDLPLDGITADILWEKIKNRRTIRQAFKNKLEFEDGPLNQNTVNNFYKLFLLTRKRLGVPVYRKAFFKSLAKYFNEQQIRIFNAKKDGEVVASIIVLQTPQKAIYAYGASSEAGRKLRANDFVMWNTIICCIDAGIKNFDFGGDSPLQETLIQYKLKWSGQHRMISTSYYGNIREADHNAHRYNNIKKIIRKMPNNLYILFSKIVVR